MNADEYSATPSENMPAINFFIDFYHSHSYADNFKVTMGT